MNEDRDDHGETSLEGEREFTPSGRSRWLTVGCAVKHQRTDGKHQGQPETSGNKAGQYKHRHRLPCKELKEHISPVIGVTACSVYSAGDVTVNFTTFFLKKRHESRESVWGFSLLSILFYWFPHHCTCFQRIQLTFWEARSYSEVTSRGQPRKRFHLQLWESFSDPRRFWLRGGQRKPCQLTSPSSPRGGWAGEHTF